MVCKNWPLFFVVLIALLGACAHDDEIRKELFDVNTRVLALENEIQDKQQTNSRQYVSASSRVSQLQEDVQKIRGEIDKLQVGIQKGEMPGQSTSHEPSIAKQVHDIREILKGYDPEKAVQLDAKMDALEKAQIEILSILERLDKKKGDKKAKASTFKTVEQAFQAKRFKEVVDEAPHLLTLKGQKNVELIRYYYSESLFRVGNVREAAISFSELLKKENLGDLGPKVRLRMGDCFRNLGDKKTAEAYYKLLIEKFPQSHESELAKKQIKKLEAKPT